MWENDSNVYLFEAPKIIGYFYFSTPPCSVICNITSIWLPLKDYITVVKDINNVILRTVPSSLDGDVNTCIDLPVPGGSPSMFWMRINKLSLFGVTSDKLIVHIVGGGIACQLAGLKSIQVGTSGPTDDNQCSINTDIVFCKNVSHTTNGTMTHCDLKCECLDLLQCSNVHIIMRSTNKDHWKLCELTIEDV
ncbi:uncharacterized protein LOC117320912 isoform X2 [Pecten maximus]|uniref:uncharacterized protein LOC117320912 isoform X2 n=1 Tax=Pecten maximus TaxID=6579 RepID=UPI001458E3D6|nr:uncharacterized protein LOC117320912 isoform X2 [Pecten maximus]